MIYLVAERENLFSTEVNSSPHVPLDFKTDTPTNGSSSYTSPKIGSFQINNTGKLNMNSDIKEDDVDIQLDKLDGRIARKRDAQLYEKMNFLEDIFVCFDLDVIIIHMENVYIVYRLNLMMKNF
jgi:hypothetical protein